MVRGKRLRAQRSEGEEDEALLPARSPTVAADGCWGESWESVYGKVVFVDSPGGRWKCRDEHKLGMSVVHYRTLIAGIGHHCRSGIAAVAESSRFEG